MFDIYIKNAKIIDGSASPWYYGDIGIKDEKITFIGQSKTYKAVTTIDAKGKYICPGFIDTHTHMEVMPFLGDCMEDRLYQGITTQVAGSCGFGIAPITEADADEWNSILGMDGVGKYPWTTYKEYVDFVNKQSIATNLAVCVPHGLIRYSTMGLENRKATSEELEHMKQLLRQSMEEGALGLSTGLIFPPAAFADTNELVELCKVVADYNGIFTVHMRSESYEVVQSVNEVIDIAKKSGVKLQISHHKSTGKENWGKVHATCSIIQQARSEGVDVMADAYPYTYGANNFSSVLPPEIAGLPQNERKEYLNNKENQKELIKRMQTDNTYENFWMQAEEAKNIILFNVPSDEKHNGCTLEEISADMGLEPYEAAFKLIAENGNSILAAYLTYWEADVKHVIKQRFTMIGSDSVPVDEHTLPHPRQYGTFSKIIDCYCLKENLFDLEEAIHKMTGLPAGRFNFTGRGYIKINHYADIVMIDIDKFKDNATIKNPKVKPDGIEMVIVNGKIGYTNNDFTNEYAGKVLLNNN